VRCTNGGCLRAALRKTPALIEEIPRKGRGDNYVDKHRLCPHPPHPARRETFFQHLGVLTHYMCFEARQQLMVFMLEGLKLSDSDGQPP
jgi:hypothetical protein